MDNDPSTNIEIVDVSESASAMDQITRAEIDMAIATARRYPRNLRKFSDDVTSMATLDQETAEGCFYSLRRKGKTIQGPSVRLAEIAVSAWGNIRAGGRVLGETPDGKFVIGQGVCHDLEKNVYIAIEVQRRITTTEGAKYGDDMIGVTSNAAVAIGFRNAVFKVIPRAMLKASYRKAIEVATGDAKTLTERRESVFERLGSLNPLITPERILASIDRASMDDVTLDDVTHLIGLGTAIRDRAQEIDEAFPEPEKVTAADIVGEKKPKPSTRRTGKKAAKKTEPEKDNEKSTSFLVEIWMHEHELQPYNASKALRAGGFLESDKSVGQIGDDQPAGGVIRTLEMALDAQQAGKEEK